MNEDDTPEKSSNSGSEKEYGLLGFIPGTAKLDDPGDEELVSTYPHLVSREFIAFGLLCMVLFLVAFFFDAPLEEIANPGKTPNPAKAPWYFLGLQELLHYAPPFIAGVLVPGLLVVTLCAVPYFRGRLRIFTPGFLVAVLVTPTFDGIIWEGLRSLAPNFATSIRTIGLPTMLLLVLSGIFLFKHALSARFDSQDQIERTRKRYYWMFVAISILLILIGQYFRGPEWSWVWPWA